MNPYIGKGLHPHVKIEVFLSSWKSIDCLIDTGYSSGVSVPQTFLKGYKEKPLAFQEFELADGSHVTFPIYKVKVRYKTLTKAILLITSKGSEGLVGIEFLKGFIFILNLKNISTSLSLS